MLQNDITTISQTFSKWKIKLDHGYLGTLKKKKKKKKTSIGGWCAMTHYLRWSMNYPLKYTDDQ